MSSRSVYVPSGRPLITDDDDPDVNVSVSPADTNLASEAPLNWL